MAEWFLPFAPPQQPLQEPQKQEVEYEEEEEVEYDPARFLVCSHCRCPIEYGEQCMEFLPGLSGVGEKSGRPVVVDGENLDHEHAVLHIGCIYDYVFCVEESLAYQDEDDVKYCAACSSKLDGDEG